MFREELVVREESMGYQGEAKARYGVEGGASGQGRRGMRERLRQG